MGIFGDLLGKVDVTGHKWNRGHVVLVNLNWEA